MDIRLGFLALAICAQLACAAAPTPPAGWRAPTAAELSAPGDAWRAESPDRFQTARGDFDGDGKKDEAVLLVSADGKLFALYFHGANGSWQQLAKHRIQDLKVMGVSTLQPGKVLTGCGSGFWTCQKGEPKEIDLTHEAILFHMSESATSGFFWSKTRKRFEQIWLTD